MKIMDSISKELLVSLDKRVMVEQLHQLCVINSGTDNLAGLKIMHRALVEMFKPIADIMETRKLSPVTTFNMSGELVVQMSGDALLIRKRPHLKRRILLVGHMDTVYAYNHPFQTITYVNDNQMIGPGVADMKGGLVVINHALNIFETTKTAHLIGWDILINADEEIGSPMSCTLFDDIAMNYQAALVYEPTVDIVGTLAKNRKGSGKITLIAKGKSAHAGRAFYDGRNAICYLAEAITPIYALNGKREMVTINVGKIAGGDAVNIVPDTAVAKLDIRIHQEEDEHWVMEQLTKIIQGLMRKDYSLTMHGSFNRPVKRVSARTTRLFQRIKAIGQQLGLTINWKDSGGCCDGNNLAHYGLAVIDTLGVRGGSIHSTGEFIFLDSLVERALLSALLLIELAEGGLEELKQ